MRSRRLVSVAALAMVLFVSVPVPLVRAAPGSPVIVSPLGGTASSTEVELHWNRVPGAAAYHLIVRVADPDGIAYVDEHTVNDRWIGTVDFAGATAWWSVAAIDGDGHEGLPSASTFTTAKPTAGLIWPADGATVTHPAETPQMLWSSVTTYDQAFYDQDVAAADPPQSTWLLKLGEWRWQVGSMAGIRPGVPDGLRSELRTFTWTWPNATPTLASPATGTHLTHGDSVRLSWGPVAGAGSYEWRVLRGTDVVAGGDATLATWGDVPGTLQPGTYQWHVRANRAGSDYPHFDPGPWSETRTLNVDPIPTPTPIGPDDGATFDTWPLLRWSEPAGADHYQLQVSDTADPQAPDAPHFTTDLAALAFRWDTWSDYMIRAHPGTATGFWRVRAIGLGYDGTPSPWTAWRSFTVDPTGHALDAPTEATPLSPDDCATDACPDLPGSPILRWSPVDGATFYRVFVAWNGNPAEYMAWFDMAGTAMPLATYYRVQAGDHASWGVVACTTYDDCPQTMPTTVRHFRLALPVPALDGPAEATTLAGPAAALAWEPVPSPAGDVLRTPVTYTLRTRTTHAGADPGPWQNGYGAQLTATIEGIGDGDAVEWSVRATNVIGIVSDWTDPRTVTRHEPPLQVVGPSAAEPMSSTPLLSWAAPDYTAFGYDVEITRAGDGALWGPEIYRWRVGATGTSVRPPFPLPPGDYRWRVRRGFAIYHTPQEQPGPWAEGTFTVAGDPELHLVAPADGATVRADSVVFEWAAMADAGEQELSVPGYSIVVGTSPDLTSQNAIYTGYSAGTRHAVQALLPEGALYWRVCSAVSCSATSSITTGASAVRTVQVTAVPSTDATPPVATAPSVSLPGAVGLAGGTRMPVVAKWSGSDVGAGMAHYDLALSTDGGPWVAAGTSTTPRATLNLRPGHTYRLRVRGVDLAANTGTWVPGRTFGLDARQQSSTAVHWTGAWPRHAASAWWGGSARSSTAAGATATTSFTGRGIAWVAAVGPGRGSARILVDGHVVATVSLRANDASMRRIVWSKTWPSTGSHTIRIRVLGTAGHPRVDVDGFVILR